MTGAEIGAAALRLAEELRVAAFDFTDRRKVTAGARGWPDYVFLGPKGLIFREVKGDTDSLTKEQTAVGYALKALGLDWAAWHSFDLRNGAIRRQLEALNPQKRRFTP